MKRDTILIIHLRVGYDGGLAREIATQIDTHLNAHRS